MVVDDVDRDAIINEMDDARTTFHHLLDAADSTGLRRRSNGTTWTNVQLLFHMLFEGGIGQDGQSRSRARRPAALAGLMRDFLQKA